MSLPEYSLHQIGQDVEFFLWDKEKETVLPSYKYFPMQKNAKEVTVGDFPKSVVGARRMTSAIPPRIFRDGLAVEVNTTPVTCRAWLWQDTMLALLGGTPQGVPNLTYTTRPYVEFSDEFKKDFPDDLKILGCNPTLDAYTERQKVVRINPMKINFRTSGLHFHMSFWKRDSQNPYSGQSNATLPPECWGPIIKLSDMLLGIPQTYIFGDELEFKRRKLYGQAGEFRFQSAYGGIEYRALSSRLYNHPGILSLFSGIWKYVIPLYKEMWEVWDPAWEDDLQLAINEGKDIEKFFPLWDKIFYAAVGNNSYILGDSLLKESFPAWKRLKELNQVGEFPDAAVYTTEYAEAHTGWTEYSRNWGLEPQKSGTINEPQAVNF